NIERQMPWWLYQHTSFQLIANPPDARCWSVIRDNLHMHEYLSAHDLLDSFVKEQTAGAATVPLLLRGSHVDIRVSIDSDIPESQQDVLAKAATLGLTKAVKDNGYTLDKESDIRLTLKVSREKTNQVLPLESIPNPLSLPGTTRPRGAIEVVEVA